MSGLDPLGRALVKDLILELKARGKTIFFSTHVTADVERVCDRVGVLVSGVFQGERVVSELMREGIDGYYCRVRGASSDILQGYDIVNLDHGVSEAFVPRDRYDAFAADLLRDGGSFELIEPRRRDLEEYFLDLVRTSGVIR
jgi:ABC-2 type transport system ATP-binding protein